MQKGFAPILILVGALVLAMVAGGVYYFGKPIINKFFARSQISVSSSTVKSGEFSELNGFPVYPGAIFVESGMNQTCNQEQQIKGLKVCNNAYYQWVTTDNFDQVRDWYAEVTKRAGWECNGGAGQYASPRNASGFGNKCIKAGLDLYELSYDASSESTKISLEVLKDSLSSEESDETANWKTYTNTKYGYQVSYPEGKVEFDEESPQHRDLVHSTGIYIGATEADQATIVLSIRVWKDLGIEIEDIVDREKWCSLIESQLVNEDYGQIGCSYGAKFAETIINSMKAFETTGGRDNSFVSIFYIPYKEYVYQIEITTGRLSEDNEIDFPISDQILSTFKFIP